MGRRLKIQIALLLQLAKISEFKPAKQTSYNLRWPISATAKHTFPRENLLFHGKTYFLTAKLTFPGQNLLSLGKTYFHGKTTAKGLELNLKRIKMATAHSLHSEDED